MKIQKYQQGGAAPAAPAPAEMGGQDPLMQILQIAGEALQSGNCEAAMAVCEALLMLAQEGEQPAPVGAPQGEPVFKKGGKLVKKVMKKGGELKASNFSGKMAKGGKCKSVAKK